jgi:threonine dehydrogenase-like Zn-dependent dehydrogenase
VACPDSLEAAVAVLAEPLAVARHALGRVPGPPGRAAILGYGPIGALVHLEISRQWPETETAVVEPAPSRRELARALGADVISWAELEARKAGRRPRLVVDAAGYPGALADALALCEDGGTGLALALRRGSPGWWERELADAVAALSSGQRRRRSLAGHGRGTSQRAAIDPPGRTGPPGHRVLPEPG